MYIDVLRRLRDTVKGKRPEKWRTNSWFLLHDNAPAHQSILVKDFLAKNNVTNLEHYSGGLITAEFYLFPQLKSVLKGTRFCDATDIVTNATDELKRFSQIYFHECFQHPNSRCQNCIVAQWDFLEEV